MKRLILMTLIGTLAIAQARSASTHDARGLGLAAKSLSEDCAGASLSGTVIYLQRIALEPNAVVEVQLEEVSRADAPATVLAKTTIQTAGKQVPIPFMLCYDKALLVPTGVYALRARISVDGTLRWTNDQRIPALQPDQPTTGLEVRVVQVIPGATTTATPDALSNSHWELARYTFEGRSVRLERQDRPELHFTPEGISGNSGCNRFAGAYTVKDGVLKVERVAGTLMLCADARNVLENAFLRVLRGSERFKVSNDRFTLTISGPKGRLVFSRILMR
jgi:putative lipoprotein